MIQTKNLKALCCGANTPAVMQSFTLQVTPHIGFLVQFFPACDLSIGNPKQSRVRNLEQINKSMQRAKPLDMVGDDLRFNSSL